MGFIWACKLVEFKGSTTIYYYVLRQFKLFAGLANIKYKPFDYGLHYLRRGEFKTASVNGANNYFVMKPMRFSSFF